MHQVHNVGNRLQRDFRAIERAAAGGSTRSQRLGATLFALGFILALIFIAGRLVEDLCDPGLQPVGHARSVGSAKLSSACQIERIIGNAGVHRVGVQLVEDLVEQRYQHAQAALVAPDRETMVMVPVEDREH